MSFLVVKELINQEEYTEALQMLFPLMESEPDSPLGLFLFGQIMLGTEKAAVGYLVFRRVTEMDPKRPEGWINYGKSAGELHKYDEEERFFKKALKLSAPGSETEFLAIRNLATAATHQCNPEKAIYWANKALKIKENNQSHIDLGYAYLMRHNFKDGWREYEYGNGYHKHRGIKNYRGEPQWDGEKTDCLVVYGEQGLGDQICYSEAVKDARKIAKKVILHINPKLTGLLGRSLMAEAYGYGGGNRDWVTDEITASCSMSSLQRLLRSGGYSGKSFLVPDPQRVIQWRSLLSTLGDKPKIGIAWTGGVHDTQKDSRSTAISELMPILQQDATWISLEYKDRSGEIEWARSQGVDIHDFSWATRTEDYDDTAALVSCLDLVISVPTSVVHLAGGLGVPCWVMVHPMPHFMFGLEGSAMPYYNSVELFRRKNDWAPVIDAIGDRLNEMRRDNPCRPGPRRNTLPGSGVGKNSDPGQRPILQC